MAASGIAGNIFSESSNSTTKLETLTTSLGSTATQMSQKVTISKLNMTTTALLKYTAITSQHKLRFRQDQAPDSDDSKEYTPMKVFKQTPVWFYKEGQYAVDMARTWFSKRNWFLMYIRNCNSKVDKKNRSKERR